MSARAGVPSTQTALRLALFGLISGIFFSYPLWLSCTRTVFCVPVLEEGHFTSLSSFATLLVVAVGIVGMVRGRLSLLMQTGLGVGLSYLVAVDINRLQPWIYVYAVIIVITTSRSRIQEGLVSDGAQALITLLSGIYFWSGFHKLNLAYPRLTFPWLIAGFVPEAATKPVSALVIEFGVTSAVIEAALGVLLFTERFRVLAVAGLVAMHLVILNAIGPFGANWNHVVWPWNVTMIALCLLTVGIRRRPAEIRSGGWRVGITLILAWVLPALNLIGWWPHYLSFALYSDTPPMAQVVLPREVSARLDPRGPDKSAVGKDGYVKLDLVKWIIRENGAPPFPEEWVYRSLFGSICQIVQNDPETTVTIERRNRLSPWASETTSCGDLSADG